MSGVRPGTLRRIMAATQGVTPRRADPHRSLPVAGTIAEEYLYAQGLEYFADSDALRFDPQVWHRASGRGYPALVAIISNPISDKRQTRSRFLLARDPETMRVDRASHAGKRLPVMTVSDRDHRLKGGIVRLSNDKAPKEIVIGKGLIATASAGLLLGLPAWAAVNAPNLEQHLDLPRYLERVHIAVGVHPGGGPQKVAEAARERWLKAGFEVELQWPRLAPGVERGSFHTELLAELNRLEDEDRA